ncbi:MAG TPA: Hpt domain-containing protein [Chiayiivirga sp.]|nr:Hpt domain-containing protein [Chiayiivirga sp.]
MRPQDDIDFTTLAWVKGELDETLKQARQALEAYVEDPSDVSQMRFCATYLHQVQGTLRMVELYGAAMVTEEMESLAGALLDGQIADRDEAYSVLMRGIMQLPDYLERLQTGHKDIPIVLLPLLNDLRTARGEKGLSEIALFTPNLGRELPVGAGGPAQPLPEAELRARAEPLRAQFQLALLKWFRNDDVDGNLARLTDTLDKLIAQTAELEARRLFWVAAGVLEALRAKAFEPSLQLKQTIGKVEREIKRLADSGERSFRTDPPHELTRNLLYFVAHAPTEHGRIGEMREVFGLEDLLPSEEEVEHARSSLTGHNRSLLDTVAGAIKDDLLRVKDALDLHLRNPEAEAAQLANQVEVLERVSDTLGMLGLGVARRVVQEQRDAVRAITDGSRAADESALLDIAGALLYVEASLDDQVQHLGGVPTGERAEAATRLPAIETRRVMQALVKEAQVNFTRAKDCFVGYIESSWDAAQLEAAPDLLSQVAGVLRIVELLEPAGYLEAIAQFTRRELLEKRLVPDVAQMETLADALASLEYFLEAQAEQRPGRDRILLTAHGSLEKLGYWPVPEVAVAAPQDAIEPSPRDSAPEPVSDAIVPAVPDARVSEDDVAASPARDDADTVEVQPIAPMPDAATPADAASGKVPPAPAPVPAEVASEPESGPITGGFEAASEEIDEEIREVFVEEVQEEIENLGQLLPIWMQAPGDLDQLKSIRRVFHTLKGSGRLVGALTLGEFAWKIENMLNRVLDHTISATPAVTSLVEAAFDVLPEIHAALRGERSVRTDLDAIKSVADRLAAGEQVHYVPTPVAPPAMPEPTHEDVPAVSEVDATAVSGVTGPPVAGAQDAIAPPQEEISAEAAFESIEEARDDRIEVATIDPVLFEILQPEVSGHLDTIEAWLAQPAQPLDEAVVRAVHTMNGAFAMTELPLVTEITSPLEHYLKRALSNGLTLSEQGRAVLMDSTRALRQVLVELEARPPRLTSLRELAARLSIERDTLPDTPSPFAPVPTHEEITSEAPELSSAVSLEPWSQFTSEEIAAPVVDEVPPVDAAAEGPETVLDETLDFDGLDVQADLTSVVSIPMADAPADADAAAAAAPASDEFPVWNIEDMAAAEIDEPAAAEPPAPSLEVEELAAGEPAAGEAVEWSELIEMPSELPAAAEIDAGLEVVEMEFSEPEFDVPEEAMLESVSLADEAAESGDEASAEATTAEAAESASAPETGVDDLIRQWLADEAAAQVPAAASTPGVDIETVDLAPAEASDPAHAGIVSADAFFDHLDDEPAPEVSSDTADAPIPVPVAEDEDVDAELLLGMPDENAAEPVEATQVPGEEIAPEWDVAPGVRVPVPFGDEAAAAPLDAFAETGSAALEAEEEYIDALIDEPIWDGAQIEEPADALEPEAAPAQADDRVVEEAAARAERTSSADPKQTMLAEWFIAGLDTADPDPDQPLRIADMDEELLDIFGEEATDILDHSDGLMARLRETPTDQELVVALQRDLHTLKGGARMAGLYAIGDLGHVMESLLEIVAEGKRALPRHGIDVLELAFDRLNRMTARVASRQAIASPVLLIQRVDMLARGEEPELVPGAVEDAAVAVEALEAAQPPIAADVVTATEVETETETPATATEWTAEEAVAAPSVELAPTALDEEDVSVRAPQEQIRIRADLLDRLVNYAGEVAIYRARLEQQLGLFHANLAEMEQTNERLRGQLRKLEIETEAQIVARYQREVEAGGREAFDPLELDRFSTLQQLSRALSESAADLVNLQGTLEDHTRQYETLLLQQSRVSSDLQEGLMRTRMVPFDSLVPRMRRIIRQTASELGKKAQLRVEGAQGEMDRSVLDRMTAPLEHMLRNGLAHGLETPEERRAVGKPEEGTVRIAVLREGSEVVIKVADDGRGLDRDAIRRKAIERGLLAPTATITDQALYAFILESGFSTASTVSKIAGRGVGMDVVHSEIRQLGGSLTIESERGKGTVFTVRLPFTLAVTQAVFVQQGETSFAVPIASVQGVARIDRSELDAQLATGAPRFVYAGEDYVIHDLGRLLGQAPVRAEGSLQVPLLLARSGDQRAAICVDHVIGSREIVVKPVGAQVSSIPGIFGATIMGDGRVIVILDVAPLVRRYTAMHLDGGVVEAAPAAPVSRVPLVMVVDDSITMRKVTGRVLERHGYEVLTAKDGVDAIEKLTERVPDVMLLDIEMPRMDGYELATHIRNDVRLRGIPIIMITSRTGEKHRQRAFEIGVDRYLGKPYQEADLMRNVDEILKVHRGDLG